MQRYSPIAPCFTLKARCLAAGALSWDPAESAEQKLHSQLLFPNINNQHIDDFFKYEYCAQFLITILNCMPINSHILIKQRACTYRDLELTHLHTRADPRTNNRVQEHYISASRGF